MAWRLYYTDRPRFTSDDGDWQEAPAWGVAAVATPDDTVGVEIDTGDYYLFDGPKPWAADMWGLVDFLLREDVMESDQPLSDLPPSVLVGAGVKFGRSVDNDVWRDLWNRIVDDCDDWRGKSAAWRYERVPR